MFFCENFFSEICDEESSAPCFIRELITFVRVHRICDNDEIDPTLISDLYFVLIFIFSFFKKNLTITANSCW